jgi:hypothetical protein
MIPLRGTSKRFPGKGSESSLAGTSGALAAASIQGFTVRAHADVAPDSFSLSNIHRHF